MTAAPHSLAAPTPEVRPTDPPAVESRDLQVDGSLQRDLFRLGVVPCAAVALSLTGRFNNTRLSTL